MGKCQIIKAGALTTLQDLGRVGFAHYAIPHGGIMDSTAARQAHKLVGNSDTLPIIECTLKGPTIQFESSAVIAISGADMRWNVNGNLIPRNKAIKINPKDILSSSYTKGSPRSYLAIRGTIDTTYHYNSCSSYAPAQLGHNKGQALTAGDFLSWQNDDEIIDSTSKTPSLRISKEISLHKGPEYNLMTAESANLLTQSKFKIGPDSNRMGARLIGPQLHLTDTINKSVPVLPGFIQLPPSGQPIVVLQDGQTTGGYPRIAYIQPEQIDAFNRLPLGLAFRFKLLQ